MRRKPVLILWMAACMALPLWVGAVPLIPDASMSRIEATMKASPPHSFTGTVNQYNLELSADPDTGQISAAAFSFNFVDFVTGNIKRDRKMLNWLNHPTWPDLRFVLDRVETTEAGPVAVGTLTLHGQAREYRIPFTFTAEGGRFVLDASCSLDHRDWGLPKVRLLVFTVDPILQITLHIEGTYAAS